MTEHYIETEAYRAMVAAITDLTHLQPDDIKIALGKANIWPEFIRGDVAA